MNVNLSLVVVIECIEKDIISQGIPETFPPLLGDKTDCGVVNLPSMTKPLGTILLFGTTKAGQPSGIRV